jgi:hypothetical protein
MQRSLRRAPPLFDTTFTWTIFERQHLRFIVHCAERRSCPNIFPGSARFQNHPNRYQVSPDSVVDRILSVLMSYRSLSSPMNRRQAVPWEMQEIKLYLLLWLRARILPRLKRTRHLLRENALGPRPLSRVKSTHRGKNDMRMNH